MFLLRSRTASERYTPSPECVVHVNREGCSLPSQWYPDLQGGTAAKTPREILARYSLSTPGDWGREGSYLLPKLALRSLGAEASEVVGTQHLMNVAVFTQGTYQTKSKWPRETPSSRGSARESL